MAIAARLKWFLDSRGAHYDLVPHPPTSTSLGAAEAAHVPGDRVDILCTIDNAPGQASGVAVTKTILQNIEVVAAGVKTETGKKIGQRIMQTNRDDWWLADISH